MPRYHSVISKHRSSKLMCILQYLGLGRSPLLERLYRGSFRRQRKSFQNLLCHYKELGNFSLMPSGKREYGHGV